jgi:hypothetical protein
MRLARLSEFRRLIFTPESAPTLKTLRKHFDTLPGATMLHGEHYIDLDEFDRVHGLSRDIAAKKAELERNPLLKGLV